MPSLARNEREKFTRTNATRQTHRLHRPVTVLLWKQFAFQTIAEMSYQRLKEILSSPDLWEPERAAELEWVVVSLRQKVNPDDPKSLDLEFDEALDLSRYCGYGKESETLLGEVFALLRNVVPFNKVLRDYLALSSLTEVFATLLFREPLKEDSSVNVITRYSRFLQYIANILTIEKNACPKFFSFLVLPYSRPLLRIMQSQHDKPAALAITVFSRLAHNESLLIETIEFDNFPEFVEVLIRKTVDVGNVEALELLTKIVDSSFFFRVHFSDLSLTSRCFILDLVSEKLTGTQPGVPARHMSDKVSEYFISRAKKHIHRLRQESYRDEKHASDVLFVKFITILALASLNPQSVVLADLELLIMCIECLRSVHVLGKQQTTGLDQRIDFDSLAGNKEEIFAHPLFGLKRDLVRLIGNMCHKNKLNQDTVRDFGGIELLCDMSSLDARNPFITEWVVLALKHLVDGNAENGQIVASLTKHTPS